MKFFIILYIITNLSFFSKCITRLASPQRIQEIVQTFIFRFIFKPMESYNIGSLVGFSKEPTSHWHRKANIWNSKPKQ